MTPKRVLTVQSEIKAYFVLLPTEALDYSDEIIIACFRLHIGTMSYTRELLVYSYYR